MSNPHRESYSHLEVAPTEYTTRSPEIVNDPAASAPQRVLEGDSPTIDETKWPLTDIKKDHATGGLTFGENRRRISGSDAPETGPISGTFSFPDTETLKEAGTPYEHQTPTFAPVPISGEHKIDNAEPAQPRKKRRGVFLGLLIALAIFLILAIALGVGLGVGLTRNHSANSSSSSNSSNSSDSSNSSLASNNLPHAIQNSTSFSVIALPNGDKRLFFQENAGNIREALFTNSTGTWASNINDIVVTNAKASTPLSALLVNNTGTSSESTGANIYLFYISQDNQLASRIFVSGTWTTRDNFSPNEQTNITFTVPSDSKALAVATNTNSTSPGAAFVFYVAQNGTAQCVSITPDDNAGIVAAPGPPLPSGVQGGHIKALAAGVSSSGQGVRPQVGVLTSNGSVEYSLYFSFFGNATWSLPELQTVLVPPLPPNQLPSVPQSLTLADAYPVTTTVAPLPAATANPSLQNAAYNESLLGDVNIAQIFVPTPNARSTGYTLFGFWVNGTNLAAYTTKNIGLSGAPKSTFPFPRLAGTTGQTSSGNVYLYHQINGTTVAEDVYSTTGGFFTTEYLNISTS